MVGLLFGFFRMAVRALITLLGSVGFVIKSIFCYKRNKDAGNFSIVAAIHFAIVTICGVNGIRGYADGAFHMNGEPLKLRDGAQYFAELTGFYDRALNGLMLIMVVMTFLAFIKRDKSSAVFVIIGTIVSAACICSGNLILLIPGAIAGMLTWSLMSETFFGTTACSMLGATIFNMLYLNTIMPKIMDIVVDFSSFKEALISNIGWTLVCLLAIVVCSGLGASSGEAGESGSGSEAAGESGSGSEAGGRSNAPVKKAPTSKEKTKDYLQKEADKKEKQYQEILKANETYFKDKSRTTYISENQARQSLARAKAERDKAKKKNDNYR